MIDKGFLVALTIPLQILLLSLTILVLAGIFFVVMAGIHEGCKVGIEAWAICSDSLEGSSTP